MDKVLGKGPKAIIKTNNSEENERYLLDRLIFQKLFLMKINQENTSIMNKWLN